MSCTTFADKLKNVQNQRSHVPATGLIIVLTISTEELASFFMFECPCDNTNRIYGETVFNFENIINWCSHNNMTPVLKTTPFCPHSKKHTKHRSEFCIVDIRPCVMSGVRRKLCHKNGVSKL